jgi:hypothetical protein
MTCLGLDSARRALLIAALLLASTHAASGQVLQHAINCGGEATGFYTADVNYAIATAGHLGGSTVFAPGWEFQTAFIGGFFNPIDALQFSGREGWTAFRFDVPDGPYMLRMHFAEIVVHGPGVRQMDLAVEGEPLAPGIDLADRVGIQYGTTLVVTTEVTDGVLDLEPIPGSDPPLLCGVEVWSLPPTVPAPPPVFSPEARAGYGRVVLTWAHDPTPTIRGYEIERAQVLLGGEPDGGAFLPVARLWAAPPRWFDEDVEPGVTYHYRIRAVDVVGQTSLSESVSATTLTTAQSTLPVFDLTIDPADQLFLLENIVFNHKEEVPATFAHGGSTWEDAETRFRGGYSRQFSKKSMKVKFPSNAPFQGRLSLNLNAEFLDGSQIHSSLGLDALRALGHPTVRHEPVQLFVNGRHQGVFNSVEQTDQQFLLSRGRDPGGVLFKADGALQVLPTLEDYESTYEIKTNEGVGHDGLIAFLEMLTDEPDATFARSLSEVFDVDGYLTYLATMIYTTNNDFMHQNYRLLYDPGLDRWELVAWDLDQCFAGSPTTSLTFDELTLDPDQVNVLFERVLADDTLRGTLARKLEALADGPLSPAEFTPSVDSAHAQLADEAPRDPFKLGWESDFVFLFGDDWINDTFLPQRQTFVLSELPTFTPPPPAHTVWINELLARNLTSPEDEAGEHEDFIELYNAGPAVVDVGGMYLTDDLANPTAWQIPANTLIASGEHLLVWADGQPQDGPLHATFSVDQFGEELALFDVDGTSLLDAIHFGPLAPDVSYGRRVDGGALWGQLGFPTPGQPNTDAGNLPPLVTWVEHEPLQPLPLEPVTVRCMAHDADGLDEVELSLRVDGADAGDFPMTALPGDRFEVELPPLPDGAVVEYWIEAEDELGREAKFPWNAPFATVGFIVQDPLSLPLRINEFLADNDTLVTDEMGEFEDWLELLNTGTGPVDLTGLHLTDDLDDPTQWTFPAGEILGAGDTLLVWADDDASDGPMHATFKLSKGGETLALFSPGGEQLLDSVVFGQQFTDISAARLPDGGDVWVTMPDPTPDGPNVPMAGDARRYSGDDPAHNPLWLSATTGATTGTPWILTVDAGAGAGGVFGAFVLGTAPVMAPVNLPGIVGDALVLPIPGVELLFQTEPDGTASVAIPIPGNPALEGLVLHAQYVIENAGLSNGVLTTIGS